MARYPDQRRPESPIQKTGRPRLPDGHDDGEDDESRRRTRMRVAQRNYRNRKGHTLRLAQSQVTALEDAMNGVLGSFNQFFRFVIAAAGDGRASMDLVGEASRTAAELSAIAQDGRAGSLISDSPDTNESASSPRINQDFEVLESTRRQNVSVLNAAERGSTHLRPNIGGVTPGTPPPTTQPYHSQAISYESTIPPRISRLQCVELAFRKLALQPSGSSRLPMILVPVMHYSAERLGMLPLTTYLPIRDGSLVPKSEIPPDQMPQLYRLVEGEEQTLTPRVSPPFVQRLQFAQTRTRITNSYPELEGDWLEATDVLEYLEERGIAIKSHACTNDGPQTTVHDLEQPGHVDMNAPTEAYSYETPAQPVTQGRSAMARLTVNLEALLTSLASMAVCLGPAPGVRRDAVDSAIRSSIVDFQFG